MTLTGAEIMAELGRWDASRPRSVQKHLGPSSLGGCREYIRATLAGEEKVVPDTLKWSAFIGTAVGDLMERALAERNPELKTQVRVTCTLPQSKIQVVGSVDLLGPEDVYDLKSKDGLGDIKRDGPSLTNWAQIAAYLIGAIQMKLLPATARGHLVYYDRSGSTSEAITFSIDRAGALKVLAEVESRLEDVREALRLGLKGGPDTAHLRDEPEQKCFYFQCEFYQQCWAGYRPTEQITHPELIATMERYDRGRELEKEAQRMKNTARDELRGVQGQSESFDLMWKSRADQHGELSYTIDLRRKRK